MDGAPMASGDPDKNSIPRAEISQGEQHDMTA